MKVQILLFQLMFISTNTNIINKLLLGFRIGISSLLTQVFTQLILNFGLLNEYQLQVELHLNYLFPFLLFCKKHTLLLFSFLLDFTCYDLLGSKFRYVLLYTLLNIHQSLRLKIKLKILE